MTETLTINNGAPAGPSLEETAANMGIDVNSIDPDATSQTAGPAAKPDIPEWVPAKFHNAPDPVKAMADAYKALEQKLGGKDTTQTESNASEEDKGAESTDAPANEAEEAVETAGLKLDELEDHYSQNGSLSDEHYEKLAKVGISKSIVDQYIAGQEALTQAFENEALGWVGGREVYGDMVTWAKSNLSAADIEAYDQAVNSRNKAATRMAMEGLKARYEATNGREPSRIDGGARRGDEGGIYESWAQVTADMAKPEYNKDAAFRAKVQAKIGRSSL